MVAFTDGRITESSSAAMSLATPPSASYPSGAFWTNNDEKTQPNCFLIDAATGNTIGTCSIRHSNLLVDPEAISVDQMGRLWLADIGWNAPGDRDNISLYMLTEPGPGSHGELPRTRFVCKYPGGLKPNAETFITRRSTGEMFIITKETDSKMYALPPELQSAASGGVNKLIDTGNTFGANVSDGAFSPDGRWLFLRRQGQNTKVFVFDASDWTEHPSSPITVGTLTQPEGITVSLDGLTLWMTSEGVGATIRSVAVPGTYQPVTADTEANVDLPVDFQIDGPTPSNPCG